MKPDISFYDPFIPQFVLEEKSLKVYEKEGKIIYTTDFFKEAYKVHQNPTYFGYCNLFKEIKRRYNVLFHEKLTNFTNECKTHFPKIKVIGGALLSIFLGQ